MKKIVIMSFAALICLVPSSCVRDEFAGDGPLTGGEVSLPVGFFMDYEGDEDPYVGHVATRAPATGIEESKVEDVWIMQFDGTADDSKLIAVPQYLASANASTQASFVQTGKANRIVAIANTSSPDCPWDATVGVTTFAEIRKAAKKINSERECYFGKHIMMAGWQDVTINASATLNIPMKRAFAKIELTFENVNTSGVTINSIAVFSVPALVDIFAGHDDHGTDIYPALTDEYYDYHLEDVTDLAAGQTRKFVWYMPANLKGATDNEYAEYKNYITPEKATHIKLYGKTALGDDVIYTVYPGANMKNDFNLKANHRYTIKLRLTTEGDPVADSRVQNYAVTELKEANSFILNPPAESGKSKVFRIYPTQVNKYFGPGGYKENSDACLDIGNTKYHWKVKIVWSTASNLVTRDGSANSIILRELAYAEGEDDYFDLEVPADIITSGNFLIGLYRDTYENGKQDDTEPYRWSWHFWVTNYNPDAGVHIVNSGTVATSQYTYSVPNGNLLRLDGESWRTGMYKNAVMMDRNLGQTSEINNYPSYNNNNLMYQFGRKEPLPIAVSSYLYGENTDNDIVQVNTNNKEGGAEAEGGGFSFEDSFANPLSFISINTWGHPAHRDWTTKPDDALYLWKDTRIKGTVDELKATTQKSLFDPCPYGWQLPSPLAFEDIRQGETVNNPGRGLDYYIYGAVNGFRYWPGTAVTDKYILFQNMGAYSTHNSYEVNWGAIRTSVPGNQSYAYFLGYGEGDNRAAGIYLDYNDNSALTIYGRAMGMNVRCVKITTP